MIDKYIKRSGLYKYLSRHKLIARYIVAGGIGAFVNIFFLYIFTSIIGVWYVTSAVFSFIISLVVTFFLQKLWAFGDLLFTKKHVLRQSVLYTLSSVAFLTINILLLYILVNLFDVWYLLAQFFSLAVVAVGSFLFNRAVTFRKVHVIIHNAEI